MREILEAEAREDFNRARKNAFFSQIFNLFSSDQEGLLSLQEVRETLRPRGETYKGMKTVPLDQIVGSEGRYRDFNSQFLPRYEHLRSRWQRVDLAHLTDIVLPPVSLYEVGGVYFVRDGNHRVSVARTQGVTEIDAEVVALETEIPLHGTMTRENLRKAVINHEKEDFLRRLHIPEFLPGADFTVTATGRYDELEKHIHGHKYFLNECQVVEIPLEQAIKSWYQNVYCPIVQVITQNNLMARFPDRTPTDLYLWIVRHWDQLKAQCGLDFPLDAAAEDYARHYGAGRGHRFLRSFRLGRRVLHLLLRVQRSSHRRKKRRKIREEEAF
ncbi:transcriptional regulator [Alkalispirochaeta sphaeroplastigenens]|uniref:Transcriptional regulator n=1 Tax=Alkalispirochaeta sphaeroplastigenens TaxID=1187066 RepID=A0A2S4JQK9_9SPIO|nr:transcriptional regulator [Alkalispirochaeta sphaeroplastigenens]POR01796.1 transcriptional regulator [Alkalispirochaeta sphaeroplastigenens]